MGKHKRIRTAGHLMFVGCQFCGETDRTLRNYEGRKICPECLKQKAVSKSGTGKECDDASQI